MKKLIGLFLCMVLLVFSASVALAIPDTSSYVDLTDFGLGDTGTITNGWGDAYFTVAPVSLSYPSSGTGVFNPFISIDADPPGAPTAGIGKGLSTDLTGQFNNKRMGNPSATDGWTHSITVGDLNPIGGGYYEFLIDINESASTKPEAYPASWIELTNLEIYIAHATSGASSTALSGLGSEVDYNAGDLGALVYSLDGNPSGFDGTVLMDYNWWSGQGQNVDVIVEVPFDLGGAAILPGDHVYTYWEFANGDADFEEIIVRSQSVPEPATMLLFGTGILCLGVFGRKKFKM